MQFPSRSEQACKIDTAESFSEIFNAAECEKFIENQMSWRQKAQVGKWLDCRARITSKELAPLPFCEKWHPPECPFYKSENGCKIRRVPVEECSRWPCKDYLKGTCTNSFCEKWHPNACSTRPRVVADLVKSASYAHRQINEQRSKRSKKNEDKSAVAMLRKDDLYEGIWQPVVNRDKSHERSGRPDIKRDTRHELKQGPTGRRSSNARQLCCVFQDMEPPKSILRKSSDMQKPIQRVKLTKGIARHTKIRDQNPSLGYICPGEPHQRSPNAPKFEDRSQEETEWQEQGAREAAWKLAKSVLKLKEQERATFFSPSEKRCLPASTLKPEEREFCCRLRERQCI